MPNELRTAEYAYHEASAALRAAVAVDDEAEGRADGIDKSEKAFVDAQTRYMEMLKKEAEAENTPAPGELMDRTSFSRFLAIAAGAENWDGAERELQEELFGEAANSQFGLPGASLRNFVPIEVLGIHYDEQFQLGVKQKRVDAVTNPDNQVTVLSRPIAQQVFNNAITSFMGVDMVTVPAGEQKFSWITQGATAGFVNRGAARDTNDLQLKTVSARPIRLSTGLVWNVEAIMAVGSNLEIQIRENVRLALASKIEDAVLNGNQAADSGSNTPAFVGCLARITATSHFVDTTSDRSTATTWKEYMAMGNRWISDNEFPQGSGKRWLMGPATFRHMDDAVNSVLTTYLPGTAGLSQFKNVALRVSDHVPDKTAKSGSNGDSQIGLFIGDGSNVKVPIWRNLLVMPSTDGPEARGRLDIHTFMNQVYARSADTQIYGMRKIRATISDD